MDFTLDPVSFFIINSNQFHRNIRFTVRIHHCQNIIV
mgnify:CR=1 FL=1